MVVVTSVAVAVAVVFRITQPRQSTPEMPTPSPLEVVARAVPQILRWAHRATIPFSRTSLQTAAAALALRVALEVQQNVTQLERRQRRETPEELRVTATPAVALLEALAVRPPMVAAAVQDLLAQMALREWLEMVGRDANTRFRAPLLTMRAAEVDRRGTLPMAQVVLAVAATAGMLAQTAQAIPVAVAVEENAPLAAAGLVLLAALVVQAWSS